MGMIMKKIVAMSMAAVAVLNAASMDEAFVAGKAEGQIRAAYVSQDNETDQDTYGTAIGGIVKYETAAWNDIKLGIGAYVSQKLHFATGSFDEGKANADLFGENTKSYAYAGEAYLDYSANDFNLRVGRQQLDTPFADTDDIRMHPNTFEAAVASYRGIEGTTLVGGYMTRWAGYDSGSDISKFKKPADGSNGVAIVGFMNESVDNLAVQGWYYGADKFADLYYADAAYTVGFGEEMGLELNAQYAAFKEDTQADGTKSGVDGNVYGIGAAFIAGPVTVGAAYNRGSNGEGKTPPIGFGGGPYVTSMEEWTIEGMEDVKAYQFSAEVDMGAAGVEGLSLSVLYGVFKSDPAAVKVRETDVIVAYAVNERLGVDASYARIQDGNDNAGEGGTDGGYSRFLVRMSYNF